MAKTKSKPAEAGSSALPAPRPIDASHVRLFKGATRVATIKGGVPSRAFVMMVMGVSFIAMFKIYLIALIAVFYPIMAVISRNDDRAFWTLELWAQTKLFAKNKRFWGAVTFTPTPYHRRRGWCRHEDS